MDTWRKILSGLAAVILFCSAISGTARSETFENYLLMHDQAQSPHGSSLSAQKFNHPLDRQSFLAMYNQPAGSIGMAAYAEEAAIESIKERCQKTEATKQACFDSFSGDPLAVLALEQAMATDDAIAKDADFYDRVGIGTAERQEYLQLTYRAFRKSKFKDGVDSPKAKLRARVRALAGENAEKALDEGPDVQPQSTREDAQKRISTDLDRARDLTSSPFYPANWKQATNDVLSKVEQADATVKAGVRDMAATNIKLFTNAETALRFSKQAAQLLGASPRDLKNIDQLVDIAGKGTKAFKSLMTLGRAAAGDFTAYANAAAAIGALFSGGGPSFESQVMEGISQILQNQKLMLKRLDFIIAQLDVVTHQLADIQRQVVIIDSNVRWLIDGQRQLLFQDFATCSEHANTILTTKKVEEALKYKTFDPFLYPYDKKTYAAIVDAAVNLRDEQNFTQICINGIPQVFKSLDQDPNQFFLVDTSTEGLRAKSYFQELVNFSRAYKKTYPEDTASKIGDLDLRILASVPASRMETLEDKISAKTSKKYSFGTTSSDRLNQLLPKTFDPYRVSDMQDQLYKTLPFVWIHDTKGKRCKNNSCEGLTNWVSEIYLKHLLNSLHLNMLVSSSEGLLQGDVMLPMIHGALVKPLVQEKQKEQEDLRTTAYKLLSHNVILRENYLRYLVYKSYQGQPRSVYRLHYYFLNDLSKLQPILGDGTPWTFERKPVDSLPITHRPKIGSHDSVSKLQVLQVTMPCVENFEVRELTTCSYPLPSPDIFSSGELVHSTATKELARARANGNRLLSVIQSYQPKMTSDRIGKAGL
jgi:hypothetical protein